MTDMRALARKLGPFTADRAGYIWCNSAKGGKTVFANVRGWGYLTGQGHGALNMKEDEAQAEQERWRDLMVEALNAYAAARSATAIRTQDDEAARK